LTLAEIPLQVPLLFEKISANIRHFLHAVAGLIPHPGTKKINIPRSRAAALLSASPSRNVFNCSAMFF
jgi:hypothetical protein